MPEKTPDWGALHRQLLDSLVYASRWISGSGSTPRKEGTPTPLRAFQGTAEVTPRNLEGEFGGEAAES